jgi:hypothetical protein
MKWIWIVLVGVVAVVAIIAACGAMLPVSHVASRRARFKQQPAAIWAAIDREKTFREDGVNYEVTRSEAPRLLETRITDKNLPYGGSWTYEIASTDGGSELRITERGEVYNPIFRFVSRFIMGHTATIDKTLRDLGKRFGEQVQVEN